MAPLIKTTIQFLLSFGDIKTPAHLGSATNPACHQSQDSISIAESGNIPSISAISWGYNRMDVYGNDLDSGHVSHKYWDGYQWGPSVAELEDLGEYGRDNAPIAISWGSNRMDIFTTDPTGHLSHKFFDGTRWRPSDGTDWEGLGGDLNSKVPVAATSWGADRMDVFGLSMDNTIHHKYWDGSSWQGYEDLLGDASSGPAAVSWGPDRNDVFVVDPNSSISHTYWDGSNWAAWETLHTGDQFSSTPTVTSWGPNRLDCFAVGSNKSLVHLWWDGSQWNSEDLGGKLLTGNVAATSWGPNRIDIVALGEDSQYYYKYYDGSQWNPDEEAEEAWYVKNGSFSSAPSVVSWGENRLDIYGVTTDAQLAHQTWYGSGWWPAYASWETLGGNLTAY